MNSNIRPVLPHDVQSICDIYNYYVENTVISFEEKCVSFEEMEERIACLEFEFPWLVYEKNGSILGYAYVSPWKSRSAYRFTLECSVYTSNNKTEKGVGTQLYQKLFEELDDSLVRSIMAVIALPNDASIGLHEKMDFRKVAHFKEVGYKLDQWVDVGYWQKIF